MPPWMPTVAARGFKERQHSKGPSPLPPPPSPSRMIKGAFHLRNSAAFCCVGMPETCYDAGDLLRRDWQSSLWWPPPLSPLLPLPPSMQERERINREIKRANGAECTRGTLLVCCDLHEAWQEVPIQLFFRTRRKEETFYKTFRRPQNNHERKSSVVKLSVSSLVVPAPPHITSRFKSMQERRSRGIYRPHSGVWGGGGRAPNNN